MNPRALTIATLRAQRAIGLHLPSRNQRGHFRPGRSPNPGGRARGALPRTAPPTMIERAYAAALHALVLRLRPAFAEFERRLPALLESARRELRGDERVDAGESKEIRELIDAARASMATSLTTSEIEALARKFAAQTSTYQRIQMNKQTTAALGMNPFLADRRLGPLVDAFVDANVGLIRNIPDKLAHDVEAASLAAVQGGKLHGDLADELASKFGFAEDRAKLIARDQVGKLYGQIAAARQRELGIRRFVWRTVHDERVRPEHEERDGQTYEYADPPEGELPGEPILCRCQAEPVLDDLLDEADATDAPAEE